MGFKAFLRQISVNKIVCRMKARVFYVAVVITYLYIGTQAAKLYCRKIVHYVADDAKKRVNAAFLIGAYSVRLSLCLLIRQTIATHVYIAVFVTSVRLEHW